MSAGSFLRRGVAAPTLLILIPVIFLLGVLAVNFCLVRQSGIETQNAIDAAAMAAAFTLATDDILVGDGTDQTRGANWFARSRDAVSPLVQANLGEAPKRFDPTQDVVFGSLAHPQATFSPYDPATGAAWNSVNAVLVTSPRRFGVGTRVSATAMLDWSVVGFRPRNDAPIPLVPLAVSTDHTGDQPDGWDARLRAARQDGTDAVAFDRATQKFAPGQDGIPEVAVILGPRSAATESLIPQVAILQVGVATFAETVEQVRVGSRATELGTDSGSVFGLGAENTLILPGTPECPALGTETRASLENALIAVRDSGEVRIWPLYSSTTPDGSSVRVTGWMGARIVSVTDGEGGGIKLTLQPAVICHPAVVAERRDDTPPIFWATNRTVCQLRLAK